MIRAIRDEGGCSRKRADSLVYVLYRAVSEARQSQNRSVTFNAQQMSVAHNLLDLVMPENTTPDPGSAHELIQRYLLREHELAIVCRKTATGWFVLILQLKVAA